MKLQVQDLSMECNKSSINDFNFHNLLSTSMLNDLKTLDISNHILY